MKALGRFIGNSNEIINANNLGIEVKEKFDYINFYFKLESVDAAYLTRDKELIIIIIGGEPWEIKYDLQLWLKIKNHLESI